MYIQGYNMIDGSTRTQGGVGGGVLGDRERLRGFECGRFVDVDDGHLYHRN